MPRLTDLSIKNLPIPTSGQVTYDDDGSPLKVRISYAGSKTFIVMLGSGNRRTIGRFGEVSLIDAREAARRLKAEKTLGRILPSTVSLGTALTEYLDDITVRAATRSYYERYLNSLTSKPLAPVSSLTPTDLHRIVDRLPAAARNQAIATYKAFFSWCQRRHYLEISPCQRFSLTKQKTRDRVLSDVELKSMARLPR